VLLDPDGFFDGLLDYLESLQAMGFVRRTALDTLLRARSVEQALTLLGTALAT
jgi:hypothetical protein